MIVYSRAYKVKGWQIWGKSKKRVMNRIKAYLYQMGCRDWAVNLLLYLTGIGLMPMGVVLTINSHLGAGGYDALNFALGDRLGIHTSYAIYITAFTAVVLAAVIRKKMLRLTTFASSLFLGIFTDVWKNILVGIERKSIACSFFLFTVGMIIIVFSVAAYILCIFPTNPTDDLVAAIREKGVRIGIAKVGLDVVCMTLAIFLKGEIGVGTIFCTLGLGPLIDVFYGWLKKAVDKYHVIVSG